MSLGPQNATETAPGKGAVGEAWARPEPGSQLGRYTLLEEIGAGAMGVVYAARDSVLGRDVALKVIRPRRMHNVDAQRRFEREARLLAAVDHPSVVEVYDVGRQAGRSYLVMPRMPGRTLRDWLAHRRSAAEILAMFDEVGAGLSAAHAAGVLHCDFKPDNVLLDAAGRPKVADFGLARLEAPETADGDGTTGTGQASGTPSYMAPELHRGATPSIATDLYAFYVALFEALVGHRPFSGLDQGALLEAKLHGIGSADVAGLPRRLRRRMRRSLDPDPGVRPRSFSSLKVLGGGLGSWAAGAALGIVGAAGIVFPISADADVDCAARARTGWHDTSKWDGPMDTAAIRATVEHVEERMGQWRSQWRGAYVQACEAHDEPRIECLTRIRVAGESWMRPPIGGSELDAATKWAGKLVALPTLERCAGGDEGRVPDASLVEALEQARFSHERGDLREAVAQSLALADRAAAMGEADLAFSARILAGEALADLRDFDRAHAVLDDVVDAAEATGRWDAAARATVQLIWVIAAGDVDLDGAQRAGRKVEAYARRSGDEPFLRAQMFALLAVAFERVGDLDAAAEQTDAALALCRAHPEDRRFDAILDLLLAQRVSVAAKNNDYATTLELSEQLPALEDALGPYASHVLVIRSALAHAHGVAGRFERSIAGFDEVARRYEQIGEGMAFWIHQTRVNAAEMELRAGKPRAAQTRLEAACPAMAAARSETHGNVLLCSLISLQAQAALGAPVDFRRAEEILGILQARFDSQRFVVRQARVIVATIGVQLGHVDRVRHLLDETMPLDALGAEVAWLRAEVEPEQPRAVAAYEAVCSVSSATLRPDLCWRALKKLETLSVTIDVASRLRALERAVPELTRLR